MDRIRARHFGHADNFVDRQIGRDRSHALADAVSFVGLEPVQAKFVFLCKDRHGLFAHLVGGAHDADGNLAPVGDEDFLEVGHSGPLFAVAAFVKGQIP